MKKKRIPADNEWVQISADELPAHTEEDLARLRDASSGPVDTSEMPELTESDFRRARPGRGTRHGAVEVTLRLDADVAAKVKTEDPGRINHILREQLLAG